MVATPVPDAPRQPMRSMERGKSESRNPTRALKKLVWGMILGFEGVWHAHIGVGLPKVLRKPPLTLFSGLRYSFSKSSGDMEMDPAVRT